MSEKILNETRVGELWEATKDYIDKQPKYSQGEGIVFDIDGNQNTINVELPSKALSVSAYESLSEEDKQKDMLYFITNANNNQTVLDGNPIGSIIAHLGVAAPDGYLICDGKEYNIADYQELADFIKLNYGVPNHFGGDGEITFAVPDLRNLFLRGYHGEAEEALSGEVGKRQEGTVFPNILSNYYSICSYPDFSDKNRICSVVHPDSLGEIMQNRYAYFDDNGSVQLPENYTARPVNMAVLYCIKAIPSIPYLEEYDTEDGWHVRKWSNGYVEMNVQETYQNLTFTKTTTGFLPEDPTRICASKLYPFPLVKCYSAQVEAYGVNVTNLIIWGTFVQRDNPLFESGSYAMISHEPGEDVNTVVNIQITGCWK